MINPKKKAVSKLWYRGVSHTLYFIPLLVMGGRMAVRLVLNLWNMIEPGGVN